MKFYNIIDDLGIILISNGYIGLKYYCIGIKGHSVHFAIFFFVEFSTATFCVVSGNKKTGSKAADWTDWKIIVPQYSDTIINYLDRPSDMIWYGRIKLGIKIWEHFKIISH